MSQQDLTDEEAYYLEDRVKALCKGNDELGDEEMMMLCYIQGMVECLTHVVRPDLSEDHEGYQVLMGLAKRAGGLNVANLDKINRRTEFPDRN